MISLKELFADSLNGFTIEDVPFFVLQLFSAGLLAVVLRYILAKRLGVTQDLKYLPLYALCIAFITIIAKNSVTIGLIFIAASVLFRKPPEKTGNSIAMLLMTTTSVGIGSGNVILSAVLAILAIVVVWLTPGQDT